MDIAKTNMEKIVSGMKGNKKIEDLFTTNISGKDVAWNMTFQFNLSKEDSFYLEIKDKKAKIVNGKASAQGVILTGEPNSIAKICNGKGDIFIHLV